MKVKVKFRDTEFGLFEPSFTVPYWRRHRAKARSSRPPPTGCTGSSREH